MGIPVRSGMTGRRSAGDTTQMAEHHHRWASSSSPSAVVQIILARSGMTVRLSVGVGATQVKRLRASGSPPLAAAEATPVLSGTTAHHSAGDTMKAKRLRPQASDSPPLVAA